MESTIAVQMNGLDCWFQAAWNSLSHTLIPSEPQCQRFAIGIKWDCSEILSKSQAEVVILGFAHQNPGAESSVFEMSCRKKYNS